MRVDKDQNYWLHDFCIYAEKQPEKIAVVDRNGSRRTDYAALTQMAASYAAYFNGKNIKKGQIVTLELGRCAEHYAAMLACFALGIVFVSVNDTMPADRKNVLYRVCSPSLKLDRNKLNEIPVLDLPLTIDETLSETDLGYIVYTSGTTGNPKAVLHDRTLFSQIEELEKWVYKPVYNRIGLNFEEEDILHAAIADFSFVLSMADFAFLIYGKTIHIISSETVHDGIALKRYLIGQKINSMNILPSALRKLQPLPDLKVALVAGEPCIYDFSDCKTQVINIYGASEAGLMAYAESKDGNVIAHSFGEARVWLDGEKEGEVCYKGRGIMLKYINDPALSESVLGKDDDGVRFLHTRDWGRRTPEGYIRIVGRMDNIVKIRGMRVSTEEVATLLGSVANIKEAAVKVTRRGEENLLCGYYVTKTGEPLEYAIIREQLQKTLPAYMIPSLFMQMKEFPRNAHGKINFKALPEIDGKTASASKEMKVSEAIEGEDEILSFVRKTFKNTLNVEAVGPDDDFVALGGSSLMAMQLQFAVQEAYGVTFSSAALLELSTPSKMAEAIRKNLSDGEKPKQNGPVYSFEDTVHLTEAQLNVYLDEKMQGESTRYNLPIRIRFETYDEDAVIKAMREVIAHHPVLKARVEDTQDGPMLKFDASVGVEYIDDRAKFVRPFDLHSALSRFAILREEKGCTLFMDLHHMVGDGTTFRVLTQELFAELDHPGILTEKPVDDGILRQLSFEMSTKGTGLEQEADEFFDRMLCDSDEVSSLLPSPDGKEGHVRRIISLDRKELTEFMKSNRLTKNQLLTSAFAYTVSRFSGCNQAMICLVEDGRGQVDLRESVGMFVRTLPLIINCGYESVQEYLKNAGECIRKAMAYDFYPLRSILEKNHVVTNIQFQYAHNLLSLNADGVQGEILAHDTVAQLAVRVEDCEEGISLLVRHDKTYSDDLCTRIAESYEWILRGLLCEKNLKDIEYTSAEDYQERNLSNRTQHQLLYQDVISAFAAQCRLNPDRPLVCSNQKTYTYRQGAQIVGNISRDLHDMKIGAGSFVAVFVERSQWYLLGTLGALACGAGYVPIDDELPDERVGFMIKNTAVCAVLVSNRTEERGKHLCGSLPIINIEATKTKKEHKDLPDVEQALVCAGISPQDICCVIYTSGSTGTPKGTLLTRIGIANVCQWHADYVGLTPDSVYGMYPSFSFVSHIEPMMSPIFKGACIDIIPKDIRFDLHGLAQYIRDHHMTHLKMGASVGRSFVHEIKEHTLQTLMLSGEKLGDFEEPKGLSVIDAYGPSEYTAQASAARVRDKFCVESVGHPIFNTKLYVVDSNMHMVPKGAIGQLGYSGIGMAAGYLGRKAESEKVFVPNPFYDGEPGYERLYLSGDMARVLPDGTIGIIGRMDSQVKINGNRVELGEVASCIRAMTDVQEAVVLPYHKTAGETSLVAYVVLKAEHDRSLNYDRALRDAVCAEVGKWKPAYMVPSFVIRIDKIPLNSNSKLDKQALPKPSFSQEEVPYATPRTELEQEIVKAFENVFQMERISIDDDFVLLGGSSLQAIRLSSALQAYDLHALNIPLLRTPRRIAEYLQQSRENRVLPVSAEKGKTKDLYYSFHKGGERDLVFIHEAAGSVISYLPIAKRLDHRITFGALENYNLIFPEEAIEEFDEAVEEKLAELRLHQPHGPYNLGGWSYGGSIAYEMAYRLEQQGETVENLFLLDSYFAKERPILGYHAMINRFLPGWASDLVYRSTFKAGNIAYDRKTARRFKNSILASDRQLAYVVRHDLKAHTVFFSAIGNRKPEADIPYLPIPHKKKGRLSFAHWVAKAVDTKMSKPLDPRTVISASQEVIQVNINHVNMLDEEPAEVISKYINRIMCQKQPAEVR